MNRNDTIETAKDRISNGNMNTSPPPQSVGFSLTSALKLFMQDKSIIKTVDNDINNSQYDHHTGIMTGEELRKETKRPFKKMQKRLLGLKRYTTTTTSPLTKSTTSQNPEAANVGPAKKMQIRMDGLSLSSPLRHYWNTAVMMGGKNNNNNNNNGKEGAVENCYRTVHPNKIINLQKMETRVAGLKGHTAAARLSRRRSTLMAGANSSCYRTVHPHKLLFSEQLETRINGLRKKHGHSSTQRRHRSSMLRTMHPNKIRELEVAKVAKKEKRVQHELFKQDDMIKLQGKGLQKRYQLIHSDLGKLLRSSSTTAMGSPCKSNSPASPSRVAPSSA